MKYSQQEGSLAQTKPHKPNKKWVRNQQTVPYLNGWEIHWWHFFVSNWVQGFMNAATTSWKMGTYSRVLKADTRRVNPDKSFLLLLVVVGAVWWFLLSFFLSSSTCHVCVNKFKENIWLRSFLAWVYFNAVSSKNYDGGWRRWWKSMVKATVKQLESRSFSATTPLKEYEKSKKQDNSYRQRYLVHYC